MYWHLMPSPRYEYLGMQDAYFLFRNSVGGFINLAALISPICSDIDEINSKILLVISYGGFMSVFLIVSFDSIKDKYLNHLGNECQEKLNLTVCG